MNKLLNAAYCVDFEGYAALEGFVKPFAAQGIGVELSIFPDAGYRERLMAQVDRFAPYYVTFHGPFVEFEATSPKGSEGRAAMVDAFRTSFDIYRAFGAHSLVIHTNQRKFEESERKALQDNAVDTLREIAALAKEKDALLLIENVGEENIESMLFDQQDFIRLFDRVEEGAGCLIDIGHAMINRWDIEAVIRTLGTRIKGYHLHNNDGVHDIHRPLFEMGGFYTQAMLQSLFDCMQTHTPDADWILEYAPGAHITQDLISGEIETVLRMAGR